MDWRGLQPIVRGRRYIAKSYVLTIDENMMCSLMDIEKRVPVREMCQRFLNTLRTPCANPTLILRVREN
jgi:hypothetical protein